MIFVAKIPKLESDSQNSAIDLTANLLLVVNQKTNNVMIIGLPQATDLLADKHKRINVCVLVCLISDYQQNVILDVKPSSENTTIHDF